MSKRKYICQWCRDKDTDDKMVIIREGKQNKRYHKDQCYDRYLEYRKFKEKEREELDELVETIKELHGIEIIPNQFYSFLQDLRNGNEMFGRIGKKKSKEGYEYRIIEQTYRECEDSINWAMNNRDFNGTLPMLKYTLAIVRDKVSGVNDRVKAEELQKAREEPIQQNNNYGLDSFSYKKKDDDEMDISDML